MKLIKTFLFLTINFNVFFVFTSCAPQSTPQKAEDNWLIPQVVIKSNSSTKSPQKKAQSLDKNHVPTTNQTSEKFSFINDILTVVDSQNLSKQMTIVSTCQRINGERKSVELTLQKMSIPLYDLINKDLWLDLQKQGTISCEVQGVIKNEIGSTRRFLPLTFKIRDSDQQEETIELYNSSERIKPYGLIELKKIAFLRMQTKVTSPIKSYLLCHNFKHEEEFQDSSYFNIIAFLVQLKTAHIKSHEDPNNNTQTLIKDIYPKLLCRLAMESMNEKIFILSAHFFVDFDTSAPNALLQIEDISPNPNQYSFEPSVLLQKKLTNIKPVAIDVMIPHEQSLPKIIANQMVFKQKINTYDFGEGQGRNKDDTGFFSLKTQTISIKPIYNKILANHKNATNIIIDKTGIRFTIQPQGSVIIDYEAMIEKLCEESNQLSHIELSYSIPVSQTYMINIFATSTIVDPNYTNVSKPHKIALFNQPFYNKATFANRNSKIERFVKNIALKNKVKRFDSIPDFQCN